jgi:hypothetical protein
MTNEYRPLFNRNYITGLMWFSLIAILILTSMGPGSVEYHEVETNKGKNIYWMELDDQPMQLVLLLQTPPALNTHRQQLQQLKSLVLQQRLRSLASTSYSFNVTPRQDRIEIAIQWASDQELPDLKTIWQTLSAPVETSRWEDTLKNIQARHYLDAQSEEQQLINRFYHQLQPNDTSSPLSKLERAYADLFTMPNIAISGEDADDYAEAVEELFAKEIATHKSPNIDNTVQLEIAKQPLQREVSNSQDFHILLGQTISARNSEFFIPERITAQVLQDVLAEYKYQHQLDFRILWSALKTTGYQALILKGRHNPEPILPQLQQRITDEVIEQSQNRLAATWEERMREDDNQIQALNLIAFYQLPTDTMEEYIDMILDQDPDEVIQTVQQAMQITQPISILKAPQR